jgi:hypothetical protein
LNWVYQELQVPPPPPPPPSPTTLLIKAAVAILSASIRTSQAPVPEHAFDHPAKVEPDAGVAVRVTVAPIVTVAVHVEPQSMPEGAEVTVPLPVLELDLPTLNVWFSAGVIVVGFDGEPSPYGFTAVTMQEYGFPLVSPV